MNLKNLDFIDNIAFTAEVAIVTQRKKGVNDESLVTVTYCIEINVVVVTRSEPEQTIFKFLVNFFSNFFLSLTLANCTLSR